MIAGVKEGTQYGVSELLEQLGVRWFMPGDLGTVIPQQRSVTIARQETIQTPSFAGPPVPDARRGVAVRLRCGGPVFPSAPMVCRCRE